MEINSQPPSRISKVGPQGCITNGNENKHEELTNNLKLGLLILLGK